MQHNSDLIDLLRALNDEGADIGYLEGGSS
jgi:hypothetical protein